MDREELVRWMGRVDEKLRNIEGMCKGRCDRLEWQWKATVIGFMFTIAGAVVLKFL